MTRDDLAADWAGGISPALTGLADDRGSDATPLDFAAATLTELLADLRLAYDTPAEAIHPDQRPDLLAIAGYLGETLLQVCSGRWDWDDEPGFAERGRPQITDPTVLAALADGYWGWDANPAGTPPGIPVLAPDPVLGIAAISPLHLVLSALSDRGGDPWRSRYDELAAAVSDYAAAHPDWAPEQTETPGVGDCYGIPGPSPILNAWLAKWDNEFHSWAERFPGDWDFGGESLDRLDDLVAAHATSPQDLDAPQNRFLIEGAVWYLGEAQRRGGRPSRWVYRDWRDMPTDSDLAHFELQSNDNAAVSLPYIILSSAAEDQDRKSRRKFDRWRS